MLSNRVSRDDLALELCVDIKLQVSLLLTVLNNWPHLPDLKPDVLKPIVDQSSFLPFLPGALLLPSYFCSTLKARIAVAKSEGNFTECILNLNLSKVKLVQQTVIHTDEASGTDSATADTDWVLLTWTGFIGFLSSKQR